VGTQKGFFGALFDLSFSDFITTRLIKILYVLAIVLCGLGALAMIIMGFSESAGLGILLLVLSPIVFLLYVIMARVWLEIIIVVFRIAENTQTLADKVKSEE
jgi:hypothetical protein